MTDPNFSRPNAASAAPMPNVPPRQPSSRLARGGRRRRHEGRRRDARTARAEEERPARPQPESTEDPPRELRTHHRDFPGTPGSGPGGFRLSAARSARWAPPSASPSPRRSAGRPPAGR
jgi:hypothetical protein